jgi:hypothetical protein
VRPRTAREIPNYNNAEDACQCGPGRIGSSPRDSRTRDRVVISLGRERGDEKYFRNIFKKS